MAMTRDVIAAADWILANKAQYNIRVANFSLHSSSPASVFFDPLDRAVEKLWLNGVVVVAAAGNYGVDGSATGVTFAPGNDPFVITVGAADVNRSIGTHDDFAAPWSAWGYTLDGFSKPELGAPGRYMVAAVPSTSTLFSERPTNVKPYSTMELSGTSFAAPVVAAAAAQVLARHPEWTPDQVKGALMVSAKDAPSATLGSLGVGMVDASSGRQRGRPAQPERGAEPVRRRRRRRQRSHVRRGQLGQRRPERRLVGERLLGLRVVGERLLGLRLLGQRLLGLRLLGQRLLGVRVLGLGLLGQRLLGLRLLGLGLLRRQRRRRAEQRAASSSTRSRSSSSASAAKRPTSTASPGLPRPGAHLSG